MVETIHPGTSAPFARVAVFDFDGTVSLIRAGWADIMLPMMLEVLTALGTGESPDDLRRAVEPFIWRLTGKDTLYQMIALAEQVTLRGGTPLDPRDYKQQFLIRLFAVSGLRIQQLRDHSCTPDQYLVPGTRALLEDLRVLRLPGVRPYHLIGFGDGPVEIEELKRAGALAVGLATDEPECRDTSPWKRRNLIEVGADYIIPNYLCRQVLLPMLFANHEPI